MEASGEQVRIYRAPELSAQERRAVATQFLSCAVCQKSLQRLETAVSCERCEIRRYCSVAHRDDAHDRDHECTPVPDSFRGMGASVARNLDMLTTALLVKNQRKRADGRTPMDPEHIRGVSHDLLASFFDVAYRGVVIVPTMHADMVELPGVQAQLAPDFGQAIFNNLMLRKAVHLVLDDAITEEEREAEAAREREHTTAYYLRQALRAYMPILFDTIERLSFEEHPNDPAARKAAQRSMARTLRRFVVALASVQRDEQLNDVAGYLAGLERRYGALFAPWKRAEGDERKDLPTVEEITVNDDEEEDVFADPRDRSSSDEEDDHFLDAEEFGARFMRTFGMLEDEMKKKKKTRPRRNSSGRGADFGDPDDSDDPDDPIDADRLFKRAQCLCCVIPLNVAGVILLTGFIDMFFRVKQAEQTYLVLTEHSNLSATTVHKWSQRQPEAYVAPLGNATRLVVQKTDSLSPIKENVFKSVGVTDAAFLYKKTSDGLQKTIGYTGEARDNPFKWWLRFMQPLRMVQRSFFVHIECF